MYQIEKKFTIPIGHLLSKSKNNMQKSIHGHNLNILVGVSSEKLNNNDMVVDFSDLKNTVGDIINVWDHCLFLNNSDEAIEEFIESKNMKVISFNFDPTAEKLAETLYKVLKQRLKDLHNINIDYISIYENENSKATYFEN